MTCSDEPGTRVFYWPVGERERKTKKERKEVRAVRRSIGKELQDACLDYNRAIFMLRGMLISAVLYGGVGAAIGALKDRMKEAAGRPINFTECLIIVCS